MFGFTRADHLLPASCILYPPSSHYFPTCPQSLTFILSIPFFPLSVSSCLSFPPNCPTSQELPHCDLCVWFDTGDSWTGVSICDRLAPLTHLSTPTARSHGDGRRGNGKRVCVTSVFTLCEKCVPPFLKLSLYGFLPFHSPASAIKASLYSPATGFTNSIKPSQSSPGPENSMLRNMWLKSI